MLWMVILVQHVTNQLMRPLDPERKSKFAQVTFVWNHYSVIDVSWLVSLNDLFAFRFIQSIYYY